MPVEKMKNKENPFGVEKNKFWDFTPAEAGKPPELILYGTISSIQSWWEDRITPIQFNKELDALGDVDEIVVRINSGGGDVFAANAIYTRLKDHKANITVKIDGWAASAATIIAMAGDTIKIAQNGVFMIHDPSMTVWDTFKEKDFLKLAEELKVVKQSIVNAYAFRTGKEKNDIETMMSEETWWTGDEAVENGFCDELMFNEAKTFVENSAKVIVNSVPLDVSKFKTLPKQLLDKQQEAENITNETSKKKEEKKMEPENITTAEALKKTYPGLVKAVKEQAVAEERKRIQDIQELAVTGFEDIIKSAMFENPISAEQTAMNIIRAQKQQGKDYLKGREKDVNDGHVGAVGCQPRDKEKNAIDAAIDEL